LIEQRGGLPRNLAVRAIISDDQAVRLHDRGLELRVQPVLVDRRARDGAVMQRSALSRTITNVPSTVATHSSVALERADLGRGVDAEGVLQRVVVGLAAIGGALVGELERAISQARRVS